MKMVSKLLRPGGIAYELLYVGLIIFFCFFYTAIVFQPRQRVGQHEEVRRLHTGHQTREEDLRLSSRRFVSRITFSGAIYISFVCVLPTILVQRFNVPFYFGGTALLIVVGVSLDTIQQIESHLILRHYDGLVKKTARMKGRR